jgi:hypothetical protein
VKDKLNLWRIYNHATAYGNRPSDLFRFETDIGAWVFDEACLLIGRKFENLLNEGKNPFSMTAQVSDGKFASAPKRFIKKVKDVHSIR